MTAFGRRPLGGPRWHRPPIRNRALQGPPGSPWPPGVGQKTARGRDWLYADCDRYDRPAASGRPLENLSNPREVLHWRTVRVDRLGRWSGSSRWPAGEVRSEVFATRLIEAACSQFTQLGRQTAFTTEQRCPAAGWNAVDRVDGVGVSPVASCVSRTVLSPSWLAGSTTRGRRSS